MHKQVRGEYQEGVQGDHHDGDPGEIPVEI